MSVHIGAAPAEVWERLSDLAGHARWMREARSIRFLDHRRSGVGTLLEVETRLGPLRTSDLLEVTAWEPTRRIGVRHLGTISGYGEFLLEPLPEGGTRFTWREDLRFPWWLGGRLGAALTAPFLQLLWHRDLECFRETFRQAP